ESTFFDSPGTQLFDLVVNINAKSTGDLSSPGQGLTYLDSAGTFASGELSFHMVQVPEPSGAVLGVLGSGGIFCVRLRKQRSSSSKRSIRARRLGESSLSKI